MKETHTNIWDTRRSGLIYKRGEEDYREPFERDRTRVIHSPSFRRLQRKRQILGPEESDFHRTRLTHSLEVASIGAAIVNHLKRKNADSVLPSLLPNDDLITVICLLHDIGHPPFGHGGETALNYLMRNHGGFESNAQTLRLITKLEKSYGNFGLDLTRRSLLGILKYPINFTKACSFKNCTIEPTRINHWKPPKAYYDCEIPEVNWLLAVFSESDQALFCSLKSLPSAEKHGQSAYKSLDCSIMNIADDIAYGVHDLEDAIFLGLINAEQLITPDFLVLFNNTSLAKKDRILAQLFDSELSQRKKAIGDFVHYFITSTEFLTVVDDFAEDHLKYNVGLRPEAAHLLEYLVKFIYVQIIDSHAARVFEYGGQSILIRLFEAINSNPRALFPEKYRKLYEEAQDKNEAYRIVCDYIANMTDESAQRLYERLLGLNSRGIFDRL